MPNPKVDSIAGWSNLSALGCLIALVLWFATTGLPEIIAKWERQSQSTRTDFKAVVSDMIKESKEQRQDFRDELQQHRELTGQMSVSGHEAVNGLSRQIADLKRAVEKRIAQAAAE
jgi:polyhydroxyalkanoate synthesis regulator phasin